MNRKFVNFDDDDSISKYFKDVKKSSILTPMEEVELAKKIKNGDENAKNKLIKSNLKFVISIAKEYQGQGLPLCDLISEGNYGLIKAATRFDHTKGFRFISYAVWWVKQSIMQSLNDNARVVRLPTNIVNRLAKLNKDLSRFELDNEREPMFNELSDGDFDEIPLLSYQKSVSLNQQINEDGDELIQLIENQDEAFEEVDLTERIKNEINKTMMILDEREKVIIENYFGLNPDVEPMTLEAIGEKYKLSKERIRQIKHKAIRKLRHNSFSLQRLINE